MRLSHRVGPLLLFPTHLVPKCSADFQVRPPGRLPLEFRRLLPVIPLALNVFPNQNNAKGTPSSGFATRVWGFPPLLLPFLNNDL